MTLRSPEEIYRFFVRIACITEPDNSNPSCFRLFISILRDILTVFIYLSVCLSVCLICTLQKMSEINVRNKCLLWVCTHGSTDRREYRRGRRRERRREHRSAWGAQSTEKNEKNPPTFGPRSILGYFKNKSGHSVFLIYHSLRTEIEMAA